MGQVVNVFLLGGVGDQYGYIVNMYLFEGQFNHLVVYNRVSYVKNYKVNCHKTILDQTYVLF